MNYPHAHVQIEYDDCESLVGFNPSDAEDRRLCHDMLDEYLDRLVQERHAMIDRGDEESSVHGNGFQVFNSLDSH
jgi:hypothetical protein